MRATHHSQLALNGATIQASASPLKFRSGVPLAVAVGLLGSMLPALAGPGDFYESIAEPQHIEEDDWEFSLTLNGWGPWVEITSAGGQNIDIGLDDILDSLQGIAEFELGVQKGKWSLNTDVIWVELEADNLGPIDSVELEEWLVTPKLGYRACEGDWGFVDLQVGTRYTYVDLDVEVDVPTVGSFSESASGDIWDFLAGFTGEYNINEKWYVPFMVEAGAGDSDFIAAAYAAVGYHFEKVDFSLGFKYLYYDFASDAPMQDQTAYGPMLKLKYTF